MSSILLVSPYWREEHRWMVSGVKLAELWQRLGHTVTVACMGNVAGLESEKVRKSTEESATPSHLHTFTPSHRVHIERVSDTLTVHRKQDFFLPDPWNYGIALGFSGFVRRLIAQTKPDIVVVNKVLFWTSLCVIPLRLRGRKVVLLTDALVGITWFPRGAFPRICAAIYAYTLGRLVLLCAHRIVFFHPQPPHVLKRLGIAHKSRVIPTGIDPAPYAPSPSRDASNDVVITYVGRLESVKGVDDFLAAVEPIVRQSPNVRVRVVGFHAPDHPLVKQYGDIVSFLGLRSDIPAILGETDIFVLPSRSEGLSNALMEAMSSACACVASDVGGNAYLLQNGVSGFLFPAGDREALRAHLTRLIADPAKRHALGVAARRRIDQEFSWDVTGKKYEELFRDVA